MVRFHQNETRRRGATIPLFAILCVPLLGMLAFSIDIGWIALVKTDLQTAADAAALAGAEKLQALYVNSLTADLPGSQTPPGTFLTTATTNTGTPDCPMYTAEQFAKYNKAGNVSINVRDQDVSFSFLDANGNFKQNYWAVGLVGGFPNSITVTTRRDNLQNTPVSLFFGPIFNFYKKELEATATATIYSGDVTSLQVIQGVTLQSPIRPHILPVALDMNIWTTFYKTGMSPDGQIHLAANGMPELYVYPIGPQTPIYGQPTNTPGSFGLIDVGPPANNSPAFRTWISNGQTPNDINYLISNSLVPVSMPGPASAPGPKNWKVGPGLTSTLQSNFYGEMFVPNLIPLFIPASAPAGVQSQSAGSYVAASGTGSGATYAIVGFAGVAVSQADGSGGNMNISIQPSALVDPTAYIQNPRPAGTQVSQFGTTINNPVITTFISAKLTQ
jgi:Flp pilus assembly protein TadG